MAEQAADDEYATRNRCGLILHKSEATSKECEFLRQLTDAVEEFGGLALEQQMFDVEDTDITGTESAYKLVEQQKAVKKLLNKYERVILAFPEEFKDAQLNEAVRMIVERELEFVIVITYARKYQELPQELQDFNVRRIPVHETNMQDVEGIARDDLIPFLQDNPQKLNMAFLNFGTGLAWSYYFGYLWYILPELWNNIQKTKWRKEGLGKDVPEDRISKTMFIVYPTNCRQQPVMEKPQDMNAQQQGRIRFYLNKLPVERACIDRPLDLDIREVQSRDGTESYYAVAYYLNILRLLVEMRDDYDKFLADQGEEFDRSQHGFMHLDEETMRREGRYCFEKLKLFLQDMPAYNKKINIDSSKFQLIEYNTDMTDRNEDLADILFDKIKESCQRPSSRNDGNQNEEETGPPFSQPVTDVFYHDQWMDNDILVDVKSFVQEYKRTNDIRDLSVVEFEEALARIREESTKIFMVLTNKLVESGKFEELFYSILHRSYSVKNRRLLVCLDCLDDTTRGHPALELLVFFKRIKYRRGEWKDKVKVELQGDPQEIGHDLMIYNIGAGLALSYYYRYSKIKIPEMRGLFENAGFVKDKFEEGLMSHKLFILHPHSCKVPKKMSDITDRVKDKKHDGELPNALPEIIADQRFYQPKLHSIMDKDKKYYAFVEFNTQAETLKRMSTEGFVEDALRAVEWERFHNTLWTLIHHPREPTGCKKWIKIIRYDDTNIDVADLILENIKKEIHIENKRLPTT